jgi:formylglycine-generating enzyme required for sulfatase activity
LRPGEKITVLGKVKGEEWYLVAQAGKTLGYVFASLIVPEEEYKRIEAGKAEEEQRRQEVAQKEVEQQKIRELSSPGNGLGSGKILRGNDGGEMLLVPAGEFVMGSNDGNGDEKPLHRLYLDDFYIDKYEVTNKLYAQFMQATRYEMPKYWKMNDLNGSNYPVVGVSWYDAQAYCAWAGKRLPTEAEWEKAARGIDGRNYSWGNQWYVKNVNSTGVMDGYAYTAPVGSFEQGKSPYGVYDMIGNVWEWVSDWYDEHYYQRSPTRNPQGPDTGLLKVLRGGSWQTDSEYDRTTTRQTRAPTYEWKNIGFRCAKTP